MSATDDRAQLDWEARFARPAALAAFGSAAVSLVAMFLPTLALGAPEDFVARVMGFAEGAPVHVITAILQAFGAALLAVVFYYLYRAAKARREGVPAATLPLAVVGPLGVAGVTLAIQIARVQAAQTYLATEASPTEESAEEALTGFAPEALVWSSLAASLALAFALVLLSVYAMRTGLFSRFLGILGIALGALNVLPLLGPPVLLQMFWTAALGFLFLDRWPGGRGPAWERVEAVPWPTAAERLEAQQRQRMEERGLTPEAHGAEASRTDAPDRPRPPSRKRRRGGRA